MNEQIIKPWETIDHPNSSIDQKIRITEILLRIDNRRMELLPLEEVLRELTSRESRVAMKEKEWNIHK